MTCIAVITLFLTFYDFYQTHHKNPRCIYDRADWTTFTLNATIKSTMIQGNINMAIAIVTNTIIRAADMAIPKSSGYARKHSRPWWMKRVTNYLAYK